MQDVTTFLFNHLALTYSLAIIMITLMIIEYIRLRNNTFRIDIPKAIQLINREHAVIFDTRPEEVFRKGHIIDATSFPQKEIMDNTKKLEKFRTKPIIVVCSTGAESQKIAALLIKRGYNSYSLSGGMRAWVAAELPIVKE